MNNKSRKPYKTSDAFFRLLRTKDETQEFKPYDYKKVVREDFEDDSEVVNTDDPKVWGPAFWFTLHNGAARYPVKASQIHKERMKGFILGIPYMLPCEKCKTHAIAYIESRMNEMDKIISGRKSLFDFFVEFHNKVNQRYGKKIYSDEEAYLIYTKPRKITVMKY